MKKIGVIALVLVLVAMTMGCSGLFGGGAKALYGTWEGEKVFSNDEISLKMVLTLKLMKSKNYELTVAYYVTESGVTYHAETEYFEGPYVYDEKLNRVDFGGGDYASVNGTTMNFYVDGEIFTLTKL